MEIADLPPAIVKSNFFLPEQLSQLAGLASIPLVDAAFYNERLKNIFQYYSLQNDELTAEVYCYAAQLLQQ